MGGKGLSRDYPPVRRVLTTRVWILLGLLLVAACRAPGGDRIPVQVVYVIDGDTVVARLAGRKVHVRLLGVDTPEIGRDGRPSEPFARAARRFTERLVRSARRVELEIAGDRMDAHGRVLGFLWLHLPGRASPVNLSEELLRAGLAEAIRFFEYPGKERFLALEREARRAGRGMWGRPPGRGASFSKPARGLE